MRKIKVLFAALFFAIQICEIMQYTGINCFAIKAYAEETTDILAEELDLGDYSSIMAVGEKQLLSVTLLPYDAGEQKLNYVSENKEVASINGMGRITAVSAGTTTITVTCGGISEKFVLTVEEKPSEENKVTDIEISNFEETLEVGKSMTISAVAVPSEASGEKITYESEAPEIAAVNQSGEIKGITAGKTIITVKAGQFTKKLELTVKVATAAIDLNTNYLVMKKGETFNLKMKALPLEADQNITLKSLDTNVAEISSSGCITAKGTGSTMIVASNADMSNAVTVIVNEENIQSEDSNTVHNVETVSDDKYSKFIKLLQTQEEAVIKAQEYEVLDSKILKYLYDNNKSIIVTGDGYELHISGNNIVNVDNELCTKIELERKKGEVTFCLNKGESLPGAVSVAITGGNYPYIYQYNEILDEYEQLNINTASEMKFDVAGKYVISQDKLNEPKTALILISVIGVIVVIIGIAAYVIIKKRYWFW